VAGGLIAETWRACSSTKGRCRTRRRINRNDRRIDGTPRSYRYAMEAARLKQRKLAICAIVLPRAISLGSR
jgi:hypothetical protein